MIPKVILRESENITMKYITVKLTEDQYLAVRKAISEAYDQTEDHSEEESFYRRLLDKLAKKAKS